jgi:hypothetical protein
MQSTRRLRAARSAQALGGKKRWPHLTVKAYYRSDLALAQLETALHLFEGEEHFAAVVTLAAAADEIFGNTLVALGRESSLESLTKAVSMIHEKLYGEPTVPRHIADRLNHAKNTLKHWGTEDTQIVKLDLEQEARDMLNRAIDNYWSLESKLSPAMENFQRAHLAA